MKLSTGIFIFWLLLACSESKMSRVDFLTGTWKMEGKEQYEVWEKGGKQELIGYSYKVLDNQKIITETLAIKIIDDHMVYKATVPDQNQGKEIPFALNDDIKAYVSFENIEHDFPKKIQYKRIGDDEILVTVLGDEGRGFSYRQLKQKQAKQYAD